MYDRKTDTYWSQLDALAIVGELSGMKLNMVPVDTVTWREWKDAYPDSEVLSQDTGFSRAYGKDPYGSYYEESYLLFPVENEDFRLHLKTFVFGVEINGVYKAYLEDDLIELKTIEDTVGGADIEITREGPGIVRITNLETGEEVVAARGFWFAWYAFHPETEVYLR